MNIKKLTIFILLSGMLLISSFAMIAPAGAVDVNVERATYVCYFVQPNTGDTVSGSYDIIFYGTYRSNTLYNVKLRVLQDGVDLTGYISISYLGSNQWGITWNTDTFDDGEGYQIHARAYRTSRSYRNFYCNDLVINNGGGPPPDTEAPSVSITNPANGATVSDTVNVQVSASDNVGVDFVEIYVDNVLKKTDTAAPFDYSWDTTAYSNSGHNVKAIAFDAAGNSATDINSVTVDNYVAPPPSNELTSGQTVYSSLASVGATEMWTIQVDANCQFMNSVLNCGSADFDLYGRLGAEPTQTTYDWRGYTTGGEDVTFDFPGQGTWYIMVRSYSGTGSYDLTTTLTYGGGGDDWGTGGKYAIVIGISDYGYISDLSYCDEDATDWYYQLDSLGYEIHVFGDGHTSNYPRYDGKATEAVVRNAIQGLAAHAQVGDSVVITTSGHGSGDGHGSSFLCMWDCSGSAGCYYDTELAADVGQFANGVDIFVFIDHCYSGGMGPELMGLSNNDYIYCTTTCTDNGYGWDVGSHQNGMWTYYFVDYSWQSHFGGDAGDSMENVFNYAHDAAVAAGYDGGDEPQAFDGNTGSSFYL